MSADSDWYARAFDSTYLEVYAHRDEEEAERATRNLLEPLGLSGQHVLDLACGAGRHARALARRGAHVIGVDLSPALLARARRAESSPDLQFVRADMRRLPFRGAAFDLVLSMFTSFGYFEREDEDRALLREVRRLLVPGGVFIVDLFNEARVRRDLVPYTRRRAGRFEVHERRRLDTRAGTVIKEIELVEGETTHRYREVVRLWSPDRLDDALAAVGLETEQVWGDYDGADFDREHSARLIVRTRARSAS